MSSCESSYEARVKRAYPKAVCEKASDGIYDVIADPGPGRTTVIGTGNSEKDAWYMAWEMLPKEQQDDQGRMDA